MIHEGDRFPTILHPGSNRIIPPKPVFQYLGYWRSYRRILMFENGYTLGIEVTPVNPGSDYAWKEMLGERRDRLFWCGRGGFERENRMCREIPSDYVYLMHEKLGPTQAMRLLYGDIWAEIEPMWSDHGLGANKSANVVSRWFSQCGENGGLPLAKLQKFDQHREDAAD